MPLLSGKQLAGGGCLWWILMKFFAAQSGRVFSWCPLRSSKLHLFDMLGMANETTSLDVKNGKLKTCSDWPRGQPNVLNCNTLHLFISLTQSHGFFSEAPRCPFEPKPFQRRKARDASRKRLRLILSKLPSGKSYKTKLCLQSEKPLLESLDCA